ncbi:pentapeptide repeat-containing protein [Streptosporangium sp. NBC_01495]|uniref:pentapeptide repeat-containing protein n=1 Tax=Streptosporangium sp. NBC_01495 TaxID=2903899 RepID=UPI002E3622ED|nr:pentapeptide repeat-containing protein [Streptosporangium sp. NBC_01495]
MTANPGRAEIANAYIHQFFTAISFDRQDLVSVSGNRLFFRKCSFVESDLRLATLEGCSFIRCDFQGANLRGASLRYASFAGCSFQNADLRDADMTGVQMTFSGSPNDPNRQASSLLGAKLQGANLADAGIEAEK